MIGRSTSPLEPFEVMEETEIDNKRGTILIMIESLQEFHHGLSFVAIERRF